MRVWLVIGCVVLAVVCYYLPWFAHETAGFTMHAYDLAEWSSLHPAVRSESPEMWTSFLLRLPLVLLAGALALAANNLEEARGRWLLRGLALVLVVHMVPPREYLDTASNDPNYRQMFQMTLLGLALVLAASRAYRLPATWQAWLLVGLTGIGVLAGWEGLSRAKTLLDNFEIDVQTGFGIAGMTVGSILAWMINLWPYLWEDRPTKPGEASLLE
ncbi:MAG: hypothetical protein GYB65_09965 [Chloroflexi bacterium]|nr:hypothetical protein [Chloroflexota bacterium]